MADDGQIGSDKAVSVWLFVTELVINAVKYAFPATKAGALILVTYEIDGARLEIDRLRQWHREQGQRWQPQRIPSRLRAAF